VSGGRSKLNGVKFLKPSAHYENLIRLRRENPAAFARLGPATHAAVTQYESDMRLYQEAEQRRQLAARYRYNEAYEKLLLMKGSDPATFARLSPETQRAVEQYAAAREAYEQEQEQ
jgi:hypothetical protein